jgi:hypothetical protein
MEKNNDLDQLFKSIYVRLGGTSIQVEIGDQDYMVAFDEALRLYRARSSNSINEGWLFLELQPGTNEYFLPRDIDSIKEIRRQRVGYIGSGTGFEPFSASVVNHMLTQPGQGQNMPGILNYELLTGYHEILGRMFGEHIIYEFDEGTGRLYLWRTIKAKENIGLHVSRLKPISALLKNGQSYRWLQNYTEQCVRCILGEKYRKFAILPGPQSGTNLKGGDLIGEATAKKAELEQELLDYGDNSYGPDLFYG